MFNHKNMAECTRFQIIFQIYFISHIFAKLNRSPFASNSSKLKVISGGHGVWALNQSHQDSNKMPNILPGKSC